MEDKNLYYFGDVINLVMEGKRVTRKSWNQESFIFLVQGSKFKVNREPLLSILGENFEVEYQSHIDIKYPDGTIGVWTATQHDMTSNDWYVV